VPIASSGEPPLTSLKKVARLIGGAAFLVLGLGFILETVRVPPDHAIVYASDSQREFVSPPFLNQNPDLRPSFLRITTYREAMDAGYSAEHRCNESACWSQDGRTVTGKWFERLGILPALESRWSADGSWNW
jgi:hypothetical protein